VELLPGEQVSVPGTSYQLTIPAEGWLRIPQQDEATQLYVVHESGEVVFIVTREPETEATARELAMRPLTALLEKADAEPDEILSDSGFFDGEASVLLSFCFRTQAGRTYAKRTECWGTAGVTRTEPHVSILAMADPQSAIFPTLGGLINGFGMASAESE